jgi:hypothetical protein
MDFEIPRDVHQLSDQDRYGEMAFDDEDFDEEQVEKQADGADPAGLHGGHFCKATSALSQTQHTS